MRHSTEPAVSVVLAEVARIAGVGRAAVSNWRRRYPDFPSPVGGTDASPQFSLSDIEEWLRKEGKIKSHAGQLERLWPEVAALGDRNTMGLVVASVGARLNRGTTGALPTPPELSAEERALVDRFVELAEQEGATKTFDFLLDRWLGTHVRQIVTTPAPLADMMAEIAEWGSSTKKRTVLDPACGTGSLLLAAACRWGSQDELRLLGRDIDPVLASVASARLMAAEEASRASWPTDVTLADTLRAGAHEARADVVLCNPPSNERDWGHAELATDARWAFGQPPRTEPELAWVQHAVAALAPGGAAVMVLPPAVAARRAGRRIRAALLRSGSLRAVIALPPGAAPPHGVGLQLWVLCPPLEHPSGATVRLVDAAMLSDSSPGGRATIDWPALRAGVLESLQGGSDSIGITVPVIDLLDEQVDLTPARHIPAAGRPAAIDLRQSWTRFDTHLNEAQDVARMLARLVPASETATVPTTTVGELELAGALEVRSGQALPEGQLQRGERTSGAVRVLTVSDLIVADGPGHWLTSADTAEGERDGSLTVTASQDVVVVGASRAFNAWVDAEAPTVLGPQLHLIRTDPALLDPWFLAGCLRSPANARQAGTHASTSSRVDIRRLQVPRLSLEEQRHYGEIARRLADFERALHDLGNVGGDLGRAIGGLLAGGLLPRE